MRNVPKTTNESGGTKTSANAEDDQGARGDHSGPFVSIATSSANVETDVDIGEGQDNEEQTDYRANSLDHRMKLHVKIAKRANLQRMREGGALIGDMKVRTGLTE